MICPTCRAVMIVVEQDKVEVDHCINCAGVWFDSGELVLMLERLGLDSHALSLAGAADLPEAKSAEKKRRCPVCGRKMKKALIGREPAILIDVCPKGDGLWFDGGEVRQTIEQCAPKPGAGLDSGNRVLCFLGDTFKAKG
jgi:Zn-finger nucleic acid-binding protein